MVVMLKLQVHNNRMRKDEPAADFNRRFEAATYQADMTEREKEEAYAAAVLPKIRESFATYPPRSLKEAKERYNVMMAQADSC